MYSIEAGNLSLMSIVNSLHARVYWPFQGGASFADYYGYLCFVLVFVMPFCLFLVALWLLASCVVFSCVFVAIPCDARGLVWCLVESIFLYFPSSLL